MTDYRFLPGLVATEIARYFEPELREGLSTAWGVIMGHGDCLHWAMHVDVGGKVYRPNMCFVNREDAEEYVQAVGTLFPQACQIMLGMTTHQFSSN